MLFKQRCIKKYIKYLLNCNQFKQLPKYRRDEILEFFSQNEFSLFFEVLAESFLEFEIKLTREVYENFLKLADKKMLNIDEKKYAFLKQIVSV